MQMREIRTIAVVFGTEIGKFERNFRHSTEQ